MSQVKRKKRKLTLLLDMDDTTCILSAPWEKWIQENGDPDFKWESVKSWQVADWTTIGSKCYDYLAIPGIFLTLEPFPDALGIINKLRLQGHTIHFVTSDPPNSLVSPGAPGDMTNAQIEKIEWLKHHFKWFNPETDITFSHSKGDVKGDVLFDDRGKWFYEFDGTFVCKDANHNKDVPGFRATNWKEFNDIVQKISEYL